jgi:predicted nucleic acid-binding protein
MICFDTGPVIWGVQGFATPGQEDMIDRTRKYIRHLDKKGQRVMIPALVLAEYLLGFELKEQDQQRQMIEQFFFVPSLDVPAAHLAARLLKNPQVVQSVRQGGQVGRQQLRIDALILATAIVNQAEKVISNDNHIHKLAQGLIPVEEVPDIPEQGELFQGSP